MVREQQESLLHPRAAAEGVGNFGGTKLERKIPTGAQQPLSLPASHIQWEIRRCRGPSRPPPSAAISAHSSPLPAGQIRGRQGWYFTDREDCPFSCRCFSQPG